VARHLTNVLEAVLDGVVLVDAEGRVEELNSEAGRLCGLAESALGQSLDACLGSDHVVSELAREVVASGRAKIERERRLAHRLPTPGVPEVVADVSAAPLFDGEGEVDGVVLVLRDRTVLDQLQHMVAEREQLETFGRIAAGIAHELKNPLGGIRGAGEILGDRAADGKTRAAAELIVREADRISALVEDFMTLARGDVLRLEPVNLHRILDDVLDLLAHDPLGARARVERLFDPSLPEISADANRLTQVFLNLARNALQALPEGNGTLRITTRISLDHRLADAEGRSLPAVAVELRDDGRGMPEEVRERLATPFFTTRPGGTGLGLTISRHWVAGHGGRLQVESAPGAGTTVRVLLPLRRPR
jgi:two-component system nitrogen regulation sensor histidine kinase GlnL